MSDINTPEAIAPPGVAPTPEPQPVDAQGQPIPVPASPVVPEQTPQPEVAPVLPIGLAETLAVDEAARASEAANAAHVNALVNSTHNIGTSLLHHTSTYVEHFDRGVKRIEQIVGR